MPAMNPTSGWFEVGDQVRNPSLVYGADVEESEHGMAQVDSRGSGMNEKKWWKMSRKNF